jgi:type VI secretion system ImpM family protein
MWQTGSHNTAPVQVSAFGKIPRMGDFVRVGSRGGAGESLEQWVEQGLSLAESKRNPAWPVNFASGAPHAFIFRPPRASNVKDAIVGVIKPSKDAVGRRFPLVVWAPAIPRSSVPWPHILPMALGDFFDAAATLLFDADAMANASEMQTALAKIPPPHMADADRNAEEYEAWATTTPLEQAWNVVFGGGQTMSQVRAVHTISETVAPFRGAEGASTKVGLRLPLGPGGIAAAAFWLDTVRRLARSPSEVRTCFWSFDGATGTAIVQLGDTPGTTLAELWVPDTNSEYLCDLTAPASVDVGRFLTKLPPYLAEALQTPGVLVRDFLDRLGR